MKTGRPETHGFRKKGQKRTPEYHAWDRMKVRCYNSNEPNFGNYGGRGIKVCDRWKDSFENFLADVGLRPSQNHSLDRIDVNGNYEPGNVRWATYAEQQNNRTDSVFVEYNGEKKTLSEWSRLTGIPKTTLSGRIKKGWPAEKIFDIASKAKSTDEPMAQNTTKEPVIDWETLEKDLDGDYKDKFWYNGPATKEWAFNWLKSNLTNYIK